ncbi:hypothetical protein [Candidatus Electronema sp. PJ]|uniref:hypothetical protein n=1 Tax=Candidatus Electronema sp. PJ TaxID=3401572 RepID=UPI003AA7C6AF
MAKLLSWLAIKESCRLAKELELAKLLWYSARLLFCRVQLLCKSAELLCCQAKLLWKRARKESLLRVL